MNRIQQIHHELVSKAKQEYPLLALEIENHGPLFIPRRLSESLLVFLARTLIKEQLPAREADTIWTRIMNMAIEEKKSTQEIFAKKYEAAIRGAGVSEQQTRALLGLSKMLLDHNLDEEGLMRAPDVESVRRIITNIWGFGMWSADMTAIFHLGLPDVWCTKDVPLYRGLRRLLPRECEKDPVEVAQEFAPYRTYLALHIWRYLDESRTKVPQAVD